MTNGNNDNEMSQVVKDLNALNFEDDEEEMYNVIDLPKHACAYVFFYFIFSLILVFMQLRGLEFFLLLF